MDVSKLELFFKQSSVVRLMRAENAPYILAFFYEVFKERKIIEVEQTELSAMLSEYLEEFQQLEVMQRTAEEYISEWCGEKCRFLKRFLAVEKNVWYVQLQAETEDVLVFMERIFEKQKGSFGTDSRMQLIVKSVKDLVLYSSGDTVGQLEQLEQEKRRIEAQIEAIKQGEISLELNEREVLERFQIIVSMLRDLTGDFRGVEQRFRDIVHGLRQREQEQADDGRTGDLLGYVLDAEDELRSNPHGASFYAFVDFVLSTDRRDEFEETLVQLASLSALTENRDDLLRLQDMMPLLTEEATKILKTTQRLSAALKRLLDPRATEEHQRLTRLMQETLRAASKLRASSADSSVSIKVDVGLTLESPMTRDFWQPAAKFHEIKFTDEKHKDEKKWRDQALQEYAALKRLDWKMLENKIAKHLKKKPQVPLREILSEGELKAGLVEVLGYIQLAHDHHHLIDESEEQSIHVAVEDAEYNIAIPKITFIREKPANNV